MTLISSGVIQRQFWRPFHKTSSKIVLTLDLDRRNFFGRGELAVFRRAIFRFVSGSYWWTHVSSPVMTRPKMSSCLSKTPWQIVTLHCFRSSVSSFGTIFAHTFLMSNSSAKIFPKCFSVDVHSRYCAPDSHPTIFTHNSTNVCNVFFSSACCWPSWSLSSLSKTIHPL